MRRLATCALSALLLFGLWGCARPTVETTLWNDALRYQAPLDSLGLIEFRNLPADQIALRRTEASRIHRESSSGLEHRHRVAGLVAVIGLTPDDVESWLALSHECERVGDWGQALQYVQSGQTAVVELEPQKRKAMKVRLALARGWLHRDRGEWNLANDWADSAGLWSPEERGVRLLKGLCLASRGDAVGALNMAREIEVKRYGWFEWRWIRGMAEVSHGDLANAYHWLRAARPVQPWSRRFWRDLATVCERLDNASEAALFHRYAFNATQMPPGAAQEIRLPVHWPGSSQTLDLPAWRGYDRLPAGGSILGWSRAAADSFSRAKTPFDKEQWAGISSTLLSYCIRSDFDLRSSLSLRGCIYAEMGATELALVDLTRFMRGADLDQVDDHHALAWYGHLLIVRRRYREALAHLERAVELDPELAQTWGDLGLARMMTRRSVSGEEAFDRALELDADLTVVWYNRGLARFHAKRWEESVSDLERALELSPDNAEIQILLQQAAQRLQTIKNRKRP